MADIVNLRRARKRKARQAAAETAQENRVRHGRSGAAKTSDARERDRTARTVDGARLRGDETPRKD